MCILGFILITLIYSPHTGADWPSGVQGKCPVGRSVLGPFGAFWGPTSAPKCPKMPFGALKKHQNARKHIGPRLCVESHSAPQYFRAFWCIFRAS